MSTSQVLVTTGGVFDGRDSPKRAGCRVAAGSTIAQILGDNCAYSVQAYLNGQMVPRERWASIRPKAGTRLDAYIVPQGGGNAGKWIRIVAMIVLTYFTAGIAAGTYGSVLGVSSASGLTALAVGIQAVGMLALTPIIPSPEPKA